MYLHFSGAAPILAGLVMLFDVQRTAGPLVSASR
jgi:hypothetical protein